MSVPSPQVVSQNTARTTQAIAIVFDRPQELDGKTLLLKTTHSLIIGHRKVKSVLTRKIFPASDLCELQ